MIRQYVFATTLLLVTPIAAVSEMVMLDPVDARNALIRVFHFRTVGLFTSSNPLVAGFHTLELGIESTDREFGLAFDLASVPNNATILSAELRVNESAIAPPSGGFISENFHLSYRQGNGVIAASDFPINSPPGTVTLKSITAAYAPTETTYDLTAAIVTAVADEWNYIEMRALMVGSQNEGIQWTNTAAVHPQLVITYAVPEAHSLVLSATGALVLVGGMRHRRVRKT
ncbi:MAG: hypothetical protein U1D30_26190 [Planctomycetota bacterium]